MLCRKGGLWHNEVEMERAPRTAQTGGQKQQGEAAQVRTREARKHQAPTQWRGRQGAPLASATRRRGRIRIHWVLGTTVSSTSGFAAASWSSPGHPKRIPQLEGEGEARRRASLGNQKQ